MESVDSENVLSNISRSTEARLFLREFYLLTINCVCIDYFPLLQ